MISAILIKLFIKNPENKDDNFVRQAYGTLGSVVGIAVNLLLSIFKIAVGLITGSISIMADGLNNLSDMGSSLVTMIGFKLAGKPADSDHPFGHGRMEYISAFIVAMLILLVGFELFKSSISSLISQSVAPQYSIFSVIVLCVSILFKIWLFLFNRKIGKKINSNALLATAQDSLNDCITTLAILICVIVSLVVEIPFNLDAILGIIVAIFIVYSGISSAKETLNQLLGTPPSPEVIADIENTILSFKDFNGIHDLIIHNYGPGRQFASVHVEVPQNIDIVKCHEEIDLCEKLLYEKLDIMVVIHMDPIDTDDQTVNEIKSKLSDQLVLIHPNLSLHDFRMTPITELQTNLIFDVVIPKELKLTQKELQQRIEEAAIKINPTFRCVITFDNDYT